MICLEYNPNDEERDIFEYIDEMENFKNGVFDLM